MPAINREELAWAGGFYSGEGCTYIHNRKRSKDIVMNLCQSGGPETLQRFQAAVMNIGKVLGPYKTKGKPRFVWTVQGFEPVQAVGAMLWEFLSIDKQEQWKRSLNIRSESPNQRRRVYHSS